jgi:hypothetical protein
VSDKRVDSGIVYPKWMVSGELKKALEKVLKMIEKCVNFDKKVMILFDFEDVNFLRLTIIGLK